MKRIVVTLLLTVALATSAGAVSNVGTRAAQFLKIGVGMRATAMGDAFVAVANDASALYWNPAGLSRVSRRQVIFNQANWIAGIRFGYVGMVWPLPNRGTIGGAMTYLGSGEMKVRTEDAPEGTGETFEVNDLALTFAYGLPFTDRFSFGFAFKYISEQIWHMSASAYAIDLGIHFDTDFHGIQLGMNLSNFGGKMRLMGEDTRFIYNIDPNRNPNHTPNVVADLRTDAFDLPTRFQVGLSGPLPVLPGIWAVDFVTPNDNYAYLNAGAEVQLGRFLSLRAGYRGLFNYEMEGGLTAGAGFRITSPRLPWKLNLDYSYLDFGRLQNAQRFGVLLVF